MNRRKILGLGIAGLSGIILGICLNPFSGNKKTHNPQIVFKPYFQVDVYPETKTLEEDFYALLENRVGRISFCYTEPSAFVLEIYAKRNDESSEKLIAENISSSYNYTDLMFREKTTTNFRFVVSRRKEKHSVEIPINFLDNKTLANYFLNPKINGNTPEVEFNNSKNPPEECSVTYRDRNGRFEVRYLIHGIPEVAEIKREKYEQYWAGKNDMFKSLESFIEYLK